MFTYMFHKRIKLALILKDKERLWVFVHKVQSTREDYLDMKEIKYLRSRKNYITSQAP